MADPVALWKEIEACTRVGDPRIREAFLRVPRAAFVRGAASAYRNEGIPVKERGQEVLSSSTTPSLMADMLDALEVPTGARVLEVGAGSGFNAALLAVLVGPAGRVVSLDIETDLVEAAAAVCRGLDLPTRPVFLSRDGRAGAPEQGPYDRIVVTAGLSFLPPAWLDQLNPGGAILLPWKFRGLDFLVRLRPCSSHQLRGPVLAPCSFPSLRGGLDDPLHRWHEVADIRELQDRAPVAEQLETFQRHPWAHLAFALYAALGSPAFRLSVGRVRQPDGRWGALSLYWSGECFSLWTREQAFHTDSQAQEAFHLRLEEWRSAGAPGCCDWELVVDFEPVPPPPEAFSILLPRGRQRLSWRRTPQGAGHSTSSR
ncbi:MAG TPA: methyltransferase domain-containing protein [Candidatus Nitrosotenuis sp.]|nr:methyltransferase domain-containing protein [Candidatus Nitrosotenuis sp.]